MKAKRDNETIAERLARENKCTVAEIRQGAKDELQARKLAQRLLDLEHHGQEARHHCPNEPQFSTESLFKAEGERAKIDGIPRHIIGRAVAIFTERIQAEEAEHKRIIETWKQRAQELMRGEFADRETESKAFFEAHRKDPDEGRAAIAEYRRIIKAERERNETARDKDLFYYVSPKTPKPDSGNWWYSRIMERAEREFMLFHEGQRIGRGIQHLIHIEDEFADTAYSKGQPLRETIEDYFKLSKENAARDSSGIGIIAFRNAYDTVKCYHDMKTEKQLRQHQRERAAQWMKDERQAGRTPTIPEAAAHFESEIESERGRGGYSSVEAFTTALHREKEALGIAAFASHTRGRKPKRGAQAEAAAARLTPSEIAQLRKETKEADEHAAKRWAHLRPKNQQE